VKTDKTRVRMQLARDAPLAKHLADAKIAITLEPGITFAKKLDPWL
jgi:hypothetical protein